MKKYPTPTARDFKDTTNCSLDSINPDGSDRDRRDRLVGAVVDRYGKPEKTMQLNPTWVEWLMGWPIGWTSMEPITDLDWRDWETDPADEYDETTWPTPNVRDHLGGESNTSPEAWQKMADQCKERGVNKQYPLRVAVNDNKETITGNIPRVATGIKHRVGRLKAIGNGQVPQVAALAWTILNN